jgi:hypothetical protein
MTVPDPSCRHQLRPRVVEEDVGRFQVAGRCPAVGVLDGLCEGSHQFRRLARGCGSPANIRWAASTNSRHR